MVAHNNARFNVSCSFMLRPFDVREVIKKRVDLEAEIEVKDYPRPLWKAPKRRKVENGVGWINFIKITLRELEP